MVPGGWKRIAIPTFSADRWCGKLKSGAWNSSGYDEEFLWDVFINKPLSAAYYEQQPEWPGRGLIGSDSLFLIGVIYLIGKLDQTGWLTAV